MHIPDGFVPTQVCLAGYGLSGLLTWHCLRRVKRYPNPTAQVPKAALLAAAFFVVSSIQIPVPPVSLHLVLNGLLGAVLGYYSFLAILVGLFFQALFLGHGGLTVLGVNAMIIGFPALLGHGAFQLSQRLPGSLPDAARYGFGGFMAGIVATGTAVAIFIGLLVTTVPAELNVATERTALIVLGIAHGPVILVEGIFAAMMVTFLQRVKPELLLSPRQSAPRGKQLEENSYATDG